MRNLANIVGRGGAPTTTTTTTTPTPTTTPAATSSSLEFHTEKKNEIEALGLPRNNENKERATPPNPR